VGATDTRGVTITLKVNPSASSLPPGAYGLGVAFTNVSNGQGSATSEADYPSVVASSTKGSNRAEPRRVPPGQPRRLPAGRSRRPPDRAVSGVHGVCATAGIRSGLRRAPQTKARLDITEDWTPKNSWFQHQSEQAGQLNSRGSGPSSKSSMAAYSYQQFARVVSAPVAQCSSLEASFVRGLCLFYPVIVYSIL
jgi:hypothetical protein